MVGLGIGTAVLCPLPGKARLIALGIGVVAGVMLLAIGKATYAHSAKRFTPLKLAAEETLKTLEAIEGRALAEEMSIRSQMDPLWKTIDEARSVLVSADARLATALAGADSSWSSHRLEEFLRGCVIRHASISGIGPSRSALLASFGIETAADVSPTSVNRVPGFGPELTRRIVEWKSGRERAFWAKGPGAAPQEWVARLKREHEQEAASAAAKLRRDAREYAQRWEHDDRRLSEIATAVDELRARTRVALHALQG